jgi:hypothetical protein
MHLNCCCDNDNCWHNFLRKSTKIYLSPVMLTTRSMSPRFRGKDT